MVVGLQFEIGEKVLFTKDRMLAQRLQDGHGGWNPSMVKVRRGSWNSVQYHRQHAAYVYSSLTWPGQNVLCACFV